MSNRNLITMSKLRRMGRWGNQLHEVAFIRTYARRYGLDYQLPPWAGTAFFGHDDPPVTATLPEYHERRRPSPHEGVVGEQLAPEGDELRGHDFVGWAQYHTSYFQPDRDFVLGLFQLQGEQRDRLQPAVDRLRSLGKTPVGLHFRRGDCGRGVYYFTPVRWYMRWLRQNWDRLDDPVMFIATEDRALIERFARYKPVTIEDLGIERKPVCYPHDRPLDEDLEHKVITGLDYLPDWYALNQCAIVLMPNSTYSFTAAWLSSRIRELWRSRLDTQDFELIDPWDTVPLRQEHLDDYPGIAGTQLPENPMYWEKTFHQTHESVPEDRAPIPVTECGEDVAFMAQALDIAARHPDGNRDRAIGCVLVRDGLVVSAGYRSTTVDQGLHSTIHGERAAIAAAGNKSRGATLYVTVEPCTARARGNHIIDHPACIDIIDKAGLDRVVLGCLDDDLGRGGAQYLLQAGLAVEQCTGVIAERARALLGDASGPPKPGVDFEPLGDRTDITHTRSPGNQP